MLYQPAATRASSSLPGLQQTAGSAVLNITVMFKLDSVNEHIHAICYFLNVLVTKSHVSIKWERTFLMLPFSHGSRISLNRHFLQSSVTVSTAFSSEQTLWAQCKHQLLLYTDFCPSLAWGFKKLLKQYISLLEESSKLPRQNHGFLYRGY